MKKLIQSKYTRISLAVLGFIVAIMAPELGLAAIIFGSTAGTSLALNISGAATTDKITTANAEHLQKSMSQIVSEIKPDDYPLDTIIRAIGKTETAIGWKHEWEEATYRPFADAVTTAYTGGAANSVALTVANPAMWEVNDTGRIAGNTTGTTPSGEELRFLVTAVSSTKITISAINAGTETNVPNVAKDAVLYRMGNANTELNAEVNPNTIIPVNKYNYCQLFQGQMEEGITRSRTKSYSGWKYENEKMAGLYDFRSRMEASHIFGTRASKVIGGGLRYFAGGLTTMISKSLNFGTGSGKVDPTINNFIDIIERTFAPSAGSEERLLLVGSKLSAGIDKINFYDRNLTNEGKTVYHGVKCTKLVSSLGEVYVKHSKTLDAQGWSTKGLILDPHEIIKAQFEPLTTTTLKLNESGKRRVKNAIRLDESCCLAPRNTGSSEGVHAILSPTA